MFGGHVWRAASGPVPVHPKINRLQLDSRGFGLPTRELDFQTEHCGACEEVQGVNHLAGVDSLFPSCGSHSPKSGHQTCMIRPSAHEAILLSFISFLRLGLR